MPLDSINDDFYGTDRPGSNLFSDSRSYGPLPTSFEVLRKTGSERVKQEVPD